MCIVIKDATVCQADVIASLIMSAMDYDCCRYFAGQNHSLDDFRDMMIYLVKREDSQYSYRNTLVALDGNIIVGACVSYDGALLHQKREVFVNAAREAFGIDYSNMDDETEAGELYVDSLAVDEEYRHQGIATKLLNATRRKASMLHIPHLGLLVDKENPKAEQLYMHVGFKYKNDSAWGGHPMKHLVCE